MILSPFERLVHSVAVGRASVVPMWATITVFIKYTF